MSKISGALTKLQIEGMRQISQRISALASLGCVCSRCQFSDPRALQIYNKDGSGGYSIHRSWMVRYEMVCRSPEDYVLLCSNCALISRWEKKGRTAFV